MSDAICYCGSKMEINKTSRSSGMDGSYENWTLRCPRCGITKGYAADGFYGREYFSTVEDVINEWNRNKAACLQMAMMPREWKTIDISELKDRCWYLIVVEGFGTPLKAKFYGDPIPEFKAFGIDGKTGDPKWLWFEPTDIQYYLELPDYPRKEDLCTKGNTKE